MSQRPQRCAADGERAQATSRTSRSASTEARPRSTMFTRPCFCRHRVGPTLCAPFSSPRSNAAPTFCDSPTLCRLCIPKTATRSGCSTPCSWQSRGDHSMPLKEYKGNLFNSSAQTLVNTVNCVGIMGKGVALEFRRRFPEMFETYRQMCEQGLVKPGQILPYKKGSPWILNFAVKNDWKHPSRMEWVESCLERFVGD